MRQLILWGNRVIVPWKVVTSIPKPKVLRRLFSRREVEAQRTDHYNDQLLHYCNFFWEKVLLVPGLDYLNHPTSEEHQ